MTPNEKPARRRFFRVERVLLPLSMGAAVVIAGLSYSELQLFRVSSSEAGRLERVLRSNEILLSSLKDLETGQRGYLLTGDRKYLEPYVAAKAGIDAQMDALRAAVRRSDQVLRVERLRPLILEKVSEVDSTLDVRERLGREAAIEAIRTDRGKVSMDAIRQISEQIRDQAYRDLNANSVQVERRANRSRIVVLLGCAALAGLLAVALTLIQSASHRRERLIADLDEAHLELHVALASIGDGLATADAEGKVQYLNPVAAQLTGWDPAEARGQPTKTVFRIEDEATGEPLESLVAQVIREQRIVGMARPANLRRRDGTVFSIDDSAAPMRDAHGRLVGVVKVFRDVTQRRIAERALERWRHVFEHAGFGMVILTPDAQPLLEQVNSACATMHGYTADELIGKPLSMLVARESWEPEARLLRGPGSGDHTVLETMHVRKDGSTFPTLSDVTVVRDASGKLAYSAAYYSDITDRKRAEDDLRQSEERYRLTADSLPQLIWTSGPDGATEYMNNRWHAETGIPPAQAGDAGWAYYLHPEDRNLCLDRWKASLQSGEAFQHECRVKTAGPSPYRWFTCRAVPVRDRNGRIFRWFGSCTDIHEQREAADAVRAGQEGLRRANEALKRSNLDLEQFAYAASHDLQEPLRMVVIYAQLLREEYNDKLDGQARAYIEFAVDGALRMEALLKDLLAYSRAAADSEGRDEEADAEVALNKVLANLQALIQEAQARIITQPLPWVKMPEIHLVQIFQNLIGNALKYRKAEIAPIIQVEARLQDGTCVFAVRDNGIGIAAEHQEQIYRIFGRLHGNEYPGTGIGLALCQKLVERNGGRIWVESKVGKGSAFLFSVPV